MSEWISVLQKLPPIKEYSSSGRLGWSEGDKTYVLISDGERMKVAYLAHRAGNREPHWVTDYAFSRPVTHWMPLPELPEKGTIVDTVPSSYTSQISEPQGDSQ